MLTVNADELETAVTLVSDQNYLAEGWVCRETGKVYVRSNKVGRVMKPVCGRGGAVACGPIGLHDPRGRITVARPPALRRGACSRKLRANRALAR